MPRHQLKFQIIVKYGHEDEEKLKKRDKWITVEEEQGEEKTTEPKRRKSRPGGKQLGNFDLNTTFGPTRVLVMLNCYKKYVQILIIPVPEQLQQL